MKDPIIIFEIRIQMFLMYFAETTSSKFRKVLGKPIYLKIIHWIYRSTATKLTKINFTLIGQRITHIIYFFLAFFLFPATFDVLYFAMDRVTLLHFSIFCLNASLRQCLIPFRISVPWDLQLNLSHIDILYIYIYIYI